MNEYMIERISLVANIGANRINELAGEGFEPFLITPFANDVVVIFRHAVIPTPMVPPQPVVKFAEGGSPEPPKKRLGRPRKNKEA